MKKHFLLAVAFTLLGLGAPSRANEMLALKSGCMGCHKIDSKLVGPAFQEIAAKYRGQELAAKLTDKVKSGSQGGVWGQMPMPPSPASEADVRQVIDWVLAMP